MTGRLRLGLILAAVALALVVGLALLTMEKRPAPDAGESFAASDAAEAAAPASAAMDAAAAPTTHMDVAADAGNDVPAPKLSCFDTHTCGKKGKP